MRPLHHRLALAASLAAVALLVAPAAPARPGGPRPPGAIVKPPPAPMQHVGYRILAEPDVVESPGRLETRAIRWSLRSVWADARGREILVRPMLQGKRAKQARDSEVVVNRPWRPGDEARQSVIFRDVDRALQRYRKLRDTGDIGALPLSADDDVVVAPPPVPVPPPPPPPPPPKPVKTCDSVLIDKGHHPTHLDKCRGVNQRCAVALLEKGHHPTHLDQCVRVEPWCAEELLARGHHPTHLSHCTADLTPGCAATLLDKGHHPTHLDKCRRVDEQCAIRLLEKGFHPTHLDQCR